MLPYSGVHAGCAGREKRALVHQVMMEPGSSRLATIISAVIMLVILVSSTTFCLETMEEYRDVTALKWVESVSIVIFTLEYLVKIVTAPNLWRFVRAPLNLIDLIAILPWYIDLFVATGKSQVCHPPPPLPTPPAYIRPTAQNSHYVF